MEKFNFLTKASIIEIRSKENEEDKTAFCTKINKALRGYSGNTMTINIPPDLREEVLDEIIADLKDAGWSAIKRNEVVGWSNTRMLDIS
ncbi:MAG: hypothetical protein COT36_04655 [Parcubacteria group bacterium CG08_land_8_20_14_0_20_38_56]|nr:MAG: hypothetical protein COT36_04655 [Parcubacteria group bacterium CG08_land_8_20_14_0_20_38_56]